MQCFFNAAIVTFSSSFPALISDSQTTDSSSTKHNILSVNELSPNSDSTGTLTFNGLIVISTFSVVAGGVN